jgi:hypothetical protein
MADGGEVPWGDEPPFRAPVFVVTHRERETLVREGVPVFSSRVGPLWRPNPRTEAGVSAQRPMSSAA